VAAFISVVTKLFLYGFGDASGRSCSELFWMEMGDEVSTNGYFE
jgi:hypothetical protein